jgi:hypothetical protein
MQKSKDAFKIGTKIENGHAVGKDPRKMSRDDLSQMGHVDRPLLKIIREKCLDCCSNEQAEVTKCTCVSCPLWPLRMSKNTLRESRKLSEEERLKMGKRLQQARSKKGEN